MVIYTPLQQHAAGWDIFPMLHGEKGAYAHLLPNGDTAPTKWVNGWERLNEAAVRAYWPKPGHHNIGLATGHRSGVWVLDIDVVFAEEDQARDYFTETTGLEIPETLSVQTASGKWHFYFRMPDNPDVRVKTCRAANGWPLVDVRGDGGMAMGIGSQIVNRETGEVSTYEVITSRAPAYAPVSLLEMVKEEPKKVERYEGTVEKNVDPVAMEMATPWIEQELQRLRDLPRPWHEGAGWHDTCFQVACNLAEFAQSDWCDLTLEDAAQKFFDAAPRPERDWNPIHEWREGVNKTDGQGRRNPNMPMDWFHATRSSKSSTGEGTVQQVEDSSEGRAPRHWGVRIDMLQKSNAPIPLGREIFKALPISRDGEAMLAHHRGEWHYWTSSHWKPTTDHEIFDIVARALADVKLVEPQDDGSVKQKPLAPTGRSIRDVEETGLAPLLRVHEPTPHPEAGNGMCIALSNGVLNVRPDGSRVMLAPTPKFFNLYALSFGYTPEAECPQWLEFLERTFAHDPEAIKALQEWFGYFLTGNPGWLQKMFWLVGPRRSGKGTILSIARAMMGDSATGTSLSELAKDFGRANLVGKGLAIIDDARDPDPRVAHQVVEFLLTLSSGGFTSIARKHKDNWDGVLSASLLAASNAIPRLPDDGGAIASRIEVIRTRVSHLGHEDTGLQARLLRELPGILNWSLDGLERLRDQGFFTQADASHYIRNEVDRGATGATPMIKDYLIESDTHGIAKSDLRNLADWWSTQQEDSWKPNAISIKSSIQAVFIDAADLQRVTTPYGLEVNKGWRGVVIKCQSCDKAAQRISPSLGPECGDHLTKLTQL